MFDTQDIFLRLPKLPLAFFLVRNGSRMEYRLERLRDLVQGLGVSKHEISVGQQVVIKGVNNLFLHVFVKIDNHISAENDMRAGDSFQGEPVVQIHLLEGDGLGHGGFDFPAVGSLCE